MTPGPSEPTNWRAMWRLIQPYWSSDEKWKARGLLAAVIALALGMVYLDVQFNTWNRDFYNALETKDFQVFKEQLWRFSWLAFIYIAVAIYRIYLTQALEINWRAWMTRQYMERWLENQAYYRIEQSRSADNPDQRIAEDLNLLTSGFLTLSLGLLSSVVTLVSFIGILWSVSGPLSFMLGAREWTIPGYMVWFAIAYAGIGSMLVWRIGLPLVRQNFLQQRYEADFRFGLIRIRENAEPVALYRGEPQERSQLATRFARIRENWWQIMRTTKRLNVASTFYAQFAIIFPFLVGAPRFFAGTITLGGLMQISSAFGQVQEALSWFINAFSSLASWKASVNRLAGFHAAIDRARKQTSGIVVTRNNVGAILLEDVVLRLPDGAPLTQPLTADIHVGQHILVTGPSGCGKSTLFRAIADIWPYGSGSIEIPADARLLFLPQKGYLPIGTLREAIAYPAAEDAYKDLAIRHYLDAVRLPHLKGLLDASDNWSQRLSPGEQQRLAFVRVLLWRPQVLFLDEATSALDAATEEALYELVLRELPAAAVISIAHRDAVAKFHQLHWQFVHEPARVSEISAAPETLRYTIQRTKFARLPAKELVEGTP
ncbi:ABC transporter ATP-binding protein/permease [Noviherbaspirillum cavernae]|uniref:ABC transporter ATP-binding protein/permease n=1 Tax=Noviherbaspirillum cavernae TaxID=2320862 RepID=A0A418X405_9BURK|nr:ABC transporter ATP-binding protein/permease [Noviherbaspirillum cavernae]RJG07193.1 ABC transporter ATP-binding protein/permease [Noviherbaspirillum cavernae]